MRHTTCRRRLAADPHDPTVDAHLAGCPECSAHAEQLRGIVAAAPGAASEVPVGLADRVVATVGSGAEPPTPLPVAHAPRRHRGPLLAATAAIVAVIALVGAALALGGDDEPADITTAAPAAALAAATESLEADTFRFTIDGTVSTRLDLSSLPRLDEMLPEGFEGFEGFGSELPFPDEMLDELPPEVREELRDRFAEAADDLDEALADPSFPDQPAWPFGDEPVDQTVSFEAEGAVDHPDRARLSGTLTSTGTPGGDRVQELEVVAIDGTTYVRDEDGWVRLRSGNAPLPVPFVDPSASLDPLSGQVGPIEDLGMETLDGEEVRHLRVEVPGVDVDQALGTTVQGGGFTIDLWIGKDDVIREMRTEGSVGQADGPVDVSIDLTVRVTDVGEPVEIEAPPEELVRDGGFPFGLGFGFDLDGEGSGGN